MPPPAFLSLQPLAAEVSLSHGQPRPRWCGRLLVRCYLEELSGSKLNKQVPQHTSNTGVAEASILVRSRESLSFHKPSRFRKLKTVQLVPNFPASSAPGHMHACTDPEMVSATFELEAPVLCPLGGFEVCSRLVIRVYLSLLGPL